VLEAILDPYFRYRQRLPFFVSWWKQPSPPTDDVVVRPAGGDLWIESHQDVQMVVHDCEPPDGDREDARKFLEAIVDPDSAVMSIAAPGIALTTPSVIDDSLFGPSGAGIPPVCRTLGPELFVKELIETGRRTFRERFILQTLALITNPLAKGGED
jgi:hypothetical protein